MHSKSAWESIIRVKTGRFGFVSNTRIESPEINARFPGFTNDHSIDLIRDAFERPVKLLVFISVIAMSSLRASHILTGSQSSSLNVAKMFGRNGSDSMPLTTSYDKANNKK